MSFGMSVLLPMRRRYLFSASRIPARAQRRAIVPDGQRVTRRDTRRTVANVLSMALVVERERRSDAPRPRPMTVSVSSRPSRIDAAAPGWAFSYDFAKCSSCFLDTSIDLAL